MFEQNYAGVFMGRTLIQARGSVGGNRSVFVKLKSGAKDELIYPTFGGMLKNPPKGFFKIYAGDLFELRYDERGEKPELYLLKTYEVARASSSETTILIKRDGYRHIPFVGDVLMKAPDTFDAHGAAYTVTAVEEAHESVEGDVWKVTLNTTLGELTAGDVLVEAQEENATGTMMVQNINGVADKDYDILYAPSTGASDFDGARYLLTPALHGIMYIHKMSPIPPVVMKMNKSRMNGWYEL